jgi:hypothetical protein
MVGMAAVMDSRVPYANTQPARDVPGTRVLRTSLWLVGSLVLTVAAFLPALVVADSARPDFGWQANAVFFAVGGSSWLLLACAGAVLLARLFSLGPVVDARAGVMAAVSLLAGTLLCLAYGGWTGASYGSSDPDNLGIGIVIPAAAVVCALYAALSAVTLRPASLASLVICALGFGLIAVIGVLNLPGLRDGLSFAGLLVAAAGLLLGAVLAWAAVDYRVREA